MRHNFGLFCSVPESLYKKTPRMRGGRCVGHTVRASDERRVYDVIRSGFVGGDGDVVDHRNAQQRFDVGVVRLGLERVPEENHEVNLSFRDFRAYLLVAAERAGQISFHIEVGRFRDEFRRSTRAAQFEAGEGFAVFHSPAHHFGFFIVVRDERYSSDFIHFGISLCAKIITHSAEHIKRNSAAFSFSATDGSGQAA